MHHFLYNCNTTTVTVNFQAKDCFANLDFGGISLITKYTGHTENLEDRNKDTISIDLQGYMDFLFQLFGADKEAISVKVGSVQLSIHDIFNVCVMPNFSSIRFIVQYSLQKTLSCKENTKTMGP